MMVSMTHVSHVRVFPFLFSSFFPIELKGNRLHASHVTHPRGLSNG